MPTVAIQQAFESAVQHHQAGRLAEAEGIYRQILARQPGHADALHLLGVIALQMGRTEVAVETFLKAIASAPANAAFHSVLGVAYRKLGRLDDAIAAYRHALELNPRIAEIHSNLGNALRDKGLLDESVAACRRALELRPDFPEALNNLGNALREQGLPVEAITALRRAIDLKPDYAEAHYNLGNAFHDSAQCNDAIAAYRRALALKPGYSEAYNNLGNVLRDLGHLDEAIATYGRALQIRPDCAETHCNLGNALREQGQLDAAIASCRRALQLMPEYPEAHCILGNALRDAGRLEESIAACRRALQLKSDFPEAHNIHGNALQDEGRFAEGVASYRSALRLRPDYSEARSNLLLGLHYMPDFDPAEVFMEHCRWDEAHGRVPGESSEPHTNAPEPGRRIRIGYVSPDFRRHSVAFFLEGLLGAHDRSQVEVVCYSNVRCPDAFTERFRRHADQWRDIAGLQDAQVAELIRRDGIDILVDLAGHTTHNRLLVFARKPAPVQVSYLGYCDTTGMKAMGYRFTDAFADPPGTTEHLHTEELVRLPQTFACFAPDQNSPAVGALPAATGKGVTFASFHKQIKINERVLRWWARILSEVPGSRMVIAGVGTGDSASRLRLSAFFAREGIDAARLEFKGQRPMADYLALHNEVDVLLDSHPFSGHTVSCHALWMGVPVVTLAGKTHCSRMVASVLANVGLPELIAQSAEEYVSIATALASDVPRMTALRAGLRERMRSSPLLDAARFARNVDAAYRQMWRAWCERRCLTAEP